MICSCHSGKLYEECCKPYHEGKAAPTPVALMRSRYAAYALCNIDYIIQTSHPDLRKKMGSRQELIQFSKQTSFDNLTILEAEGDTVTFKAHLSQNGKDISFIERSLFKKVKDRWYYAEGITF